MYQATLLLWAPVVVHRSATTDHSLVHSQILEAFGGHNYCYCHFPWSSHTLVTQNVSANKTAVDFDDKNYRTLNGASQAILIAIGA